MKEHNKGSWIYKLGGLVALALLLLNVASIQRAYALPIIIVDTTAGTTVTNDGTINIGEYVGASTGINIGFGDIIGASSFLHVDSDTSGNLNFGLQTGNPPSDWMVIYIDTDNGATGYSTTAGFTDTADLCRNAISGFDGTDRATLNFASGFAANYAICLDPQMPIFAGVWGLVDGGSHPFITDANVTNVTANDYEMNLTLSDLGINPGDSFRYVATYLNATPTFLFRSDEFHGVAPTTVPPGNPGLMTVSLASGDFNTFKTVDDTLIVDRADDPDPVTANACDDVLPNDCSLRGAILTANSDTTSAYTISFDPVVTTVTLAQIGVGEDANATGDLDITDDLTIQGNGARNTIIDGNGITTTDRVFHVLTAITATFNDVTIENGDITGDGGGLLNEGGTVNISRSTISDNNASGNAGGIYNFSGPMNIEASTISDNSANGAAGILNVNSTGLVINNSTISNNISTNWASALSTTENGSDASTTLNHVTITGNQSNADNFEAQGSTISTAELDSGTAVVNMINTLLTGNVRNPGTSMDPDGCHNVFGGTFNGSYSVVGSSADPLSCPTGGTNTTIAGLPSTVVDSSLVDNGGATDTHALVDTGEAVDVSGMMGSSCASVDQRGVARPQGADCDAGAYELVNAVAPGVGGGDGPGGVGVTDGSSSLEAWYRADRGIFSDGLCIAPTSDGNPVACWADQSGNNVNATQGTGTPVFTATDLNGQPTLTFNGSNSQLQFNRVVQDDFTLISMFNTNQSAGGCNHQWYCGTGLIDAEVGGAVNDFGLSLSQGFVTTGVGNPDVTIRSASTYNNSAGHMAFFHRTAGTGAFQQYVDGSQTGTSSGSMASLNASGRITIGSLQNDVMFYNGNSPEVIVFSANLPDVDRILVENYLGAKYDTPISNDFYDGDTGDFDLDVAGIGRFGSVSHTQSHAAGMIVVDDNFLQDNGDWLLFGHRTPVNDNSTDDLPTTGDWASAPDPQRWLRHFYIDVTDDTTTVDCSVPTTCYVDIIFDYSECGMDADPLKLPSGLPSNYRLLKRTSSTGQFADIATATAIVGDQVHFQGVDVNDLGSNFTLGSLNDADSPTAVTLNSFTTNNQSLSLLAVLLVGVLTLGLSGLWLRRRTVR